MDGSILGYNPYRDTEGKFDDGPELLASRGRPKVSSTEQRKKIDAAKEKLRAQYAVPEDKPEREKVLEGPKYLETAGFAVNESNLSSDNVRMVLWRDKELFPGQTYGQYYATEKAKKADIFMMTPAEYRQSLVESGQYKNIEGIERRMDWAKVDQYAEDIQSGDKFPPPSIGYDEEGKTEQEGLHRIYAAEKVGIQEVPVVVYSDTRNQDIYPYKKLEGKILSQEQIHNDSETDVEEINLLTEPSEGMAKYMQSKNPITEKTKLYRGEGEGGGTGTALYGAGLYIATDKKYAAQYGEVREVPYYETPDNPAIFATEQDFKQFEYEYAKALGIPKQDLYKLGDTDERMMKLGYDGVIIGPRSDAIIVAYDAERFEQIQKGGGSVSGSAIMSQEQAAKETEDSALGGRTFYHGTNLNAATSIAEAGLRPSVGPGQLYGDGIYLTEDAAQARGYAEDSAFDENTAQVVVSYIDVEKAFTADDKPSIHDLTLDELKGRGVIGKDGVVKDYEQFAEYDSIYQRITQELLDEFGAVEIPPTSTHSKIWIVKDPSSVKTFEIGDAAAITGRELDREMGLNSVRTKAVNQISARDYAEIYEDLDIDTDDLGCIMLDLEPMQVLKYVEGKEEELFENPKWDQGSVPAETVPHVTLLYGLLENGNKWKDKVDALLKDWKVESVKIDHVGFFDTPDSYAVVAHLEKTPELVDGHERLTLLPHVNTFSEYLPHMTLAYVKKEADVEEWVKALNKQYKGKKVKAAGINYGDRDDESDTKNDASGGSLSSVGQDHNAISPSGLIVAYNALESGSRDIIKAQENALKNGFANIERRITEAAINRVQKNYLEEASDLITASERKKFEQEVEALLNTFYINLYPIFGRQLLAQRSTEYGVVGTYQMTTEAQRYIQEMAQKAAVSHVNTVIQDLLTASAIVYAGLAAATLVTLVVAAVAAGNVKIKKKLEDGGYALTEVAIQRAVNAGLFNNTEMYQEAQKLARQGEGQATIVRTLQNKYQDISKNRATTIARTESARVFNQSQFEADKQFLNDSGLMPKAYKKLRSRTGTPCEHCEMLIAMPPIPFMKNFADLGSTLKATVTKEDGTVKVKTLPINYEAVSAGNVHPNCNCEYVLIIKD